MTPERWQQIKNVLAEALEEPPANRSAYLDRSCAGDEDLRREVELCLDHERELGPRFLNETALPRAAADAMTNEGLPWVGRRIGAYKTIELIGVGGMGEVYRAFRADDQYRQEVALKVVRAGQDSGVILARFRNERQILASLEHPNIARLLDGGTTEEGAPYLVMELIEGQTIGQYCDSRRLSISDRLALFTYVCAAVQYAHQRLIIHRDIKPSNILVTPDGVPKLLDFGIAKVLGTDLQSQSTETLTAFRALTPGYASPEQIKGEPVTTASDVYSLGVVLYELLTGRSPYLATTGAPQQLVLEICEIEPEKPSAATDKRSREPNADPQLTVEEVSAARGTSPLKLRKRLKGDLDNIVLMALRKEPSRRYASVEQFAEDIRRNLATLPVVAQKDTARYRASKFVARHKAGVAAAAAIAITLLIGLAVTLHEARIARAERARAEQRFRDMRELARSNLFEFHDAIQNLPGSASARNLVIRRALGYLDKLSRDEAGDRGLMEELAAGYERVAVLQADFSGPGIGDSAAALASFQKAFTIRESLTSSSGNDVSELKSEYDLLEDYTRVSLLSGKAGQASSLAHRGLALTELLAQKRTGDRESVLYEARAHSNLGRVMGGNGSSASTRELPEAILQERDSIKLLTQISQGSQTAETLRSLFRSEVFLAHHLRKNREFEASLKTYDSVWSISGGLQGLPNLAKALFYNYRSQLLDDMSNFRRASDDERKALAILQSTVQADPHDLVAQINAAGVSGTLGVDEARLGSKVAGKEKLDKAIEEGERLLAANPHALYYENLLLLGHSYQGEILSSIGNQAEAQPKYSQALEMATELAHNDPQDMESRLNIAKLHVALGVVLARAKRYSEARQELVSGSSHLDQLLSIRPHDADALYVAEMTRNSLATLDRCLTGRACAAAQTIQLPNLNN